MLSKEQIDRLDWLAHGATAGDWNFGTYANGVLITTTERDKHNPIAKVVGEYAVPWDKTPLSAQTYNNAEYIAAANPQAVRELIAMLRECQKDAARYRYVQDVADDLCVCQWCEEDSSWHPFWVETLDKSIDEHMRDAGVQVRHEVQA